MPLDKALDHIATEPAFWIHVRRWARQPEMAKLQLKDAQVARVRASCARCAPSTEALQATPRQGAALG
jgi:hypothetical protein